MRVNVVNRKGEGFNNAGSVLTGPLVLSGNPTQPMEAATKQYLDLASNAINASNITTGVLSVSRLPAFEGDFTSLPGSNALVLKDVEGLTPGTYTKVTVDAKGRVIAGGSLTNADIPDISWAKVTVNKPSTLAGYGITDGVSTNGDTVTGHITLHADPTSGLQLATKQYVDQTATTAGAVKVGDTIRRTSTVTPSGYLRCNGGMANKTTYAALYAVIGDTSYDLQPGSGQPWRQQYQTNLEPSADITGWTTGTSLPAAIAGSQAIVTKNRVYLLGGLNNGARSSTVYTAPINADGTLGAWSTGTSLPAAIAHSQAIVTKNHVYLLGGLNVGEYISNIHTAPINADGTLGTWTTGTSLPGALTYSQAIVTKNRVYLLGGYDGTGGITSTVYTAPVNADGTLGTWTTGTSIPGPLAGSQAIVTKNRVYLLAGVTAGGYTNIVYTAPINTDGTLGAWTSGTSLPVALTYSQAIVTKNRVYLLGGYDGTGGITSTVYTAPVNADGTLGAWTTGTPLPGTLGNSQAIVTKNRVYLLGGHNSGGYTSTVYTASFSGGLNDYSPYYDGSIVLNTDTTFALPDTTTTDPVGIYTYIKY